MNAYVADTHALFWYLTASPQLGANAKAAFDEGVQGSAIIHISVIVLAELHYLNTKLGKPLDFEKEWQHLESSGQFVFIPFEPDDILEFTQDAAVPEMHDRIIIGIARRLSASCLTKDVSMVSSGIVPTIW